jgi:hypothetical protein
MHMFPGGHSGRGLVVLGWAERQCGGGGGGEPLRVCPQVGEQQVEEGRDLYVPKWAEQQCGEGAEPSHQEFILWKLFLAAVQLSHKYNETCD